MTMKIDNPSSSSSSTDEKVKYKSTDPTAGYLSDKVVAGTGITIAEGTGANENKILISNSFVVPEEITIYEEYPVSSALKNFILYADISGTPPSGTVFDIAPDDTSFTVMLPIPHSYVSGSSNLKFWKGSVEQNITEGIRTYVSGRNQCPLSLDWVFAFRCDEQYDATADVNGEYRVTWERKLIPIQPEAIPFSKEDESPFFMDGASDNLMLPQLPRPYVYQLHRWIRKDVSQYGITSKKQGDLGVMKDFNCGTNRYRLACRGDEGEHTLKQIASRLDDGYRFFMTGWNSALPRTVPFKISIYNTDTGATSYLSHSYGQYQTGGTYTKVGIRRILEK